MRSKLNQNVYLSTKVVGTQNYNREYSIQVDDMAIDEKKKNIKFTLPLIALCVPLFANYSATMENGCPFETYVRVDGKCLDISEEGLNDITEKLDSSSVIQVNKEVAEINEELEELSEELEELCIEEQPETTSQIEIMEDVCQY
ncbi:MAG: hypothetical protein ACFCAD_02125 [Pleurocapsa sp.]